MPSVRDIRRRIRSVNNTGKVTNAMSLIAASKMRRAQNAVLQGRPYSEKIQEVIAHLAAQPTDDIFAIQPLLQTRLVERVTVLVISPDRVVAPTSVNGCRSMRTDRAAGPSPMIRSS